MALPQFAILDGLGRRQVRHTTGAIFKWYGRNGPTGNNSIQFDDICRPGRYTKGT